MSNLLNKRLSGLCQSSGVTLERRHHLDASEQAPECAPSVIAEERFEEHSPGLDEGLRAIRASADIEIADVRNICDQITIPTA